MTIAFFNVFNETISVAKGTWLWFACNFYKMQCIFEELTLITSQYYKRICEWDAAIKLNSTHSENLKLMLWCGSSISDVWERGAFSVFQF